MGRTVLPAVLVLGLIASPAALAQAPDPDVAKGIKLVDEGDYDGAILTLDNAARRLAADPAKAKELSQAYLYLGIAYVGKGHEAAAKAKFREAIGQIKDLSLSPDKFPPKVIDLFEAARQEAAKAPPSAQPQAKKGGSKKGLLIGGIVVGGVVVVGGGVAAAVALSGSEDKTPADTRKVDTFSGSLCGYAWQEAHGGCDQYRCYDVVVSSSGTLDATATWTDPTALFTMVLFDQNTQEIALSNRTTNTSSQLSAAVTPQTAGPTSAYGICIGRDDDNGPANFELVVRHP